jgi:Serine carboxypeptidase
MVRSAFLTVFQSMATLTPLRNNQLPGEEHSLTTSRQAIITLPNATCPNYAQAAGTCGTFSYANESLTANSTHDAAPTFYRALQGFMGAMPQYSRNSFHFSSESYGGHYGPIFNKYIEAQNAKNIPGAHNVSLETVLIGYGPNPVFFDHSSYPSQKRMV